MSRIQADSHVTLHYRMALMVDGVERELVNTFGAHPATLQMGVGQWSPPVEARLLGLAQGEAVQFELGPEQAYGPRRADLVRHLPLSLLSAEPAGEALSPGVTVAVNDPAGMRVHGVLAALEGTHARVDFNHPLSGHALRVRVQVLGVLDKE